MSETFAYIGRRFTKGLREAPYEFVAPLILAARGAKVVIQFVSGHLDLALDEARKKADRSATDK